LVLALDTYPTSDGIPSFDELPTLGETGERHSWDVFGRQDELGCLNFITSAEVVAATAEVRTGEVVNLNLPLGQPQPQFWADRAAPQYSPLHNSPNIRDDYIDKLYTQGSTQWDGFRHLRYRQYGYYGGRQDDALDVDGELGIDVWAQRGIIGRGVLVDVPGYMTVAPDERLPIGPQLIEAILDAQGTIVRPGDILVVRTGWLEWYLRLDAGVRTELAARLTKDRSSAALPGLDPSREMTAWMWNRRVAAAAVDNPTAETVPYIREEGWAHHRLLVLLGLPLGELWSLATLAASCRREQRWSFLLTTAPMNIPRGVASPANAYAVL
jgi:kynurenine formamidase